MNSIHRIGFTIASLATAATIAGAFVVQGYVAAQQAAQQQAQQTAQQQAMALVAQASASPAPQLVYVKPLPTPQVITPVQPTQPPQQVIHIIVPSAGGDDGGSDD
jgi:hypothetical protein